MTEILVFQIIFVTLQLEAANLLAAEQKESVMKAKTSSSPIRTKEEVLAWLDAARQRKIAWERKVDAKFSERKRLKKEAEESGYYDLEWA